MEESVLSLNDEEFKEQFQSKSLNQTIREILILENDDNFQLIVDRIETFNLELANYLQIKRKYIKTRLTSFFII